MLGLKAPHTFKVGRNDPEQEVAITCHKVTFNDLPKLADGSHEPFHLSFILPGQPDAGEHGHSHPGLGRIDDGRITLNHAGLFQ